jgi:hypothetical protein
MIQKLLLTIFAIAFAFQSFSQTTIPANSQVSGTWTKSGSPYLIKGNISVPRNNTLVIEAGVQVRFDGKYMLGVYGNIKAIGAEGDTVRFYPQDTMNRWLGIRYFGSSQATDSAQFEYCQFEYAGPKLTNEECALKMTGGHFNIKHCLFTKNNGMYYPSSLSADSILSLNIENCYFYRNANVNTNPSLSSNRLIGVAFFSRGTIKNTIFESNVSKNPYSSLDDNSVNGDGSGGTLYINDYNAPQVSIEIIGCQFINNYCALQGAGIELKVRKNGKIQIKNCSFTNNRTGRYGCVTYIGNNSSSKSNMKLVIDSCSFSENIATNSFVGDGVSCITLIQFKTNDSVFVKNCLFEKNVARATVKIGTPFDGRQYLMNNVFRGNALWCVSAENSADVWSINNVYHNNMSLNLSESNSSTYYFRSINDAYLFNGPNIDTIELGQQFYGKYDNIFYRFDASTEINGGRGGMFKNCVFWGNRNYLNKITNISIGAGVIQEVSNCIFEGNPDSSILWTNDLNPNRPNPIVLTYQNNINANPLFVNPPSAYGPKGLNNNIDFHLLNTCSQLSPAYNTGSNSALSSWSNILDKDGNTRIVCDTIDIGPYELGTQKHRVKIAETPKDSTYCDNNLQMSIASTCNPNTKYQWQYLNGQTWSNLSNSNNSVWKSSQPLAGNYRVIYTQQDCNTSDTSRSIVVSLKPAPKPNLGRDTTIEQRASLTLNSGTFNTYKWQDASTSQTYTINGNSAGIGKKTYHIEVTSANGCYGKDSIEVTVTWNSSLENLLAKGWKIYPNPATDFIHVESPDSQEFEWILKDAFGREIQSNTSQSETSILTHDLPNGIYYLQIQTEKGSESLKVIKTGR